MYDDTIVEVSIDEYEKMRDQLTEYHELLEQLASVYENLSIDLVELGEIDLEETLERANTLYNNE
tara:strand:- start:318 stop:512 length:195 start_codon:yes stop_codon:yes gene_type:complete